MGEQVDAVAREIFSGFESGRPDPAGRRMASMDRRFTDVNEALRQLQAELSEIRRKNFRSQLPNMSHEIRAVTARVMNGDREECHAAGMDEFVPKPINSKTLLGLIEKLAGAPPVSVASLSPVTPGHLDESGFLVIVGGDRALALELVDLSKGIASAPAGDQERDRAE